MKAIWESMKKNKLLVLLVILELVIMIVTLTGYGKEKLRMEIPYQDLVGTTIPEDRGGWYMDETFPCEPSGLFDHTEDIPLKKGTYDITVYYDTDTDLNYCTTTADTVSYPGLYTDKTPLSHKVHEVTYTIYLMEDVNNFRIETYFGGTGYMIIKGFAITETRAFLRIFLCVELCLAVLVNFIILGKQKKWFERISNKRYYEIICILGIGLLASYPVMGGYLIFSHDIGFHLLRIEGIKEGLLAGQFPVKMQPNWLYGYGYPTSLYYGDLFLYFPALLRLIGLPVQISYGIFVGVMNVATAGIAYWSFKRICKDEFVGMAASLLFTLAPYRLNDVYIRSAVGESLAFTFLPLILYGIYQVFTKDIKDRDYTKLWVPMVIGFSGIIQSHLLTCIMCGEFIILTCILQIKKVFTKERFLVLCKTVVYTALINLWFILPCAVSMKGIEVTLPYRARMPIQNQGAQMTQLFSLFYPGKGDGNLPEMGVAGEVPNGIGFALMLGLGLFLLIWVKDRKRKDPMVQAGKYTFFLSILAVAMTTIFFPWDWCASLLGKSAMAISNIQFATRYLAIANTLIVATLGIALSYLKQYGHKEHYVSAIVTITLLGLVTGCYIMNDRENTEPATYIYDIEALGRTDHNVKEYLMEGTDIDVLIPNEVNQSENISLTDYRKSFITMDFTCKNEGKEGYIELPVLYYPQYRATDNKGRNMELGYGTNNVIRVKIPKAYEGTIHVSYQEPLLWRISETISVLSIVLITAVFIHRKRKTEGALKSETDSIR